MDVKIGVIYTSKELVVELEGGADEARKAVDAALAGSDSLVWLTDTKVRCAHRQDRLYRDRRGRRLTQGRLRPLRHGLGSGA